ncbi:caspase family protein [Streptococcus mitis]|jgi:pneumococcal surface protein A|uniref:caspase family protein n=1 Tax=Streptococcus mitis TaxID=28037 RepID=UPI0020006E7E|nr:caspase family protein [Streptococcus mitis]
MKKILLSTVALLSLVSTLPVNSPVYAQESSSQTTYSKSSGSWIKSGSRWWYKHSDGSYTTNGWEQINGTWYYFDNEGWMKTGWIKESGNWYYLDDSGAMKTGLQTIGGNEYYLSTSGAMQTGWQNIGDDTYFFADSGARQTINRRALVLGETSTIAVPIADVNTMEKVFSNQNFSKVVRFPDKTKAEIIAKMQELFESSSESDVNYLYLTCHGGIDGRIYLGSDGQTFSGWELASILKQYKGKFVVMLDCCHAGTIISKDNSIRSNEESITEKFDMDEFVLGFTNTSGNEKAGEMIDSKFLVLCSSRGAESSSGGDLSLATKYWSLGSGWDPVQQSQGSLIADQNFNNRITLNELYSYSREQVLKQNHKQHIEVYPENSQFVLFQK